MENKEIYHNIRVVFHIKCMLHYNINIDNMKKNKEWNCYLSFEGLYSCIGSFKWGAYYFYIIVGRKRRKIFDSKFIIIFKYYYCMYCLQ